MDMREKILRADDTVYEVVKVPEWGCEVVIRSINGAERDRYEESLMKESRKKVRGRVQTERKFAPDKLRAKLIVLAACKAVGDPTPLFRPEDVDALAGKSGAALDKLFDVAQRLGGLTEQDVEELTGN